MAAAAAVQSLKNTKKRIRLANLRGGVVQLLC
jgi:hypothetical protein